MQPIVSADWEEHIPEVQSLVIQWLKRGGLEHITPENFHETLKGRTMVLPHSVWAHHGFSGSCKPDKIALDYTNEIAALVAEDKATEFISQQSAKYPNKTSEVHYGGFKALCGMADEPQTKNLNKVTCEHCLLEITIALPVGSEKVN